MRPNPETVPVGGGTDEVDDDLVAGEGPASPVHRQCAPETVFDLVPLKPGAVLINISRGPVVDEQALATALHGGQPGGAGLDVCEDKPLPAESPLWRLENVIVTPHVAGLSAAHTVRCAEYASESVVRLVRGKVPKGANVEACGNRR